MLNLNSRASNTSTEVKFCVKCGEANYENLGQCVSCGRKKFISESEFEKEQKVGFQEMIVGALVFFISLGLVFLRLNVPVNNSIPKLVMLPFVFLGLFIAVDGAFKYQKGRRSIVLNVILSACALAVLGVGIYYDLL
jgi:hypothetical protein